jgi:PadR family transcriptional regulator AphA
MSLAFHSRFMGGTLVSKSVSTNQELSNVGAVPSSAAAPAHAPELSFAEHVCLALVAEGASHGWAVGTELAPTGGIGRVWTLSRPLTYRAIDGLVDKRLVRRRGRAEGRGPARLALAPTAAGRRALRGWLDAPVQHLRDVRTELLVKVSLRQRAGLDNDAFLVAQQQVFAPLIDVLVASSDGDLVDLWRRESARAVRRFLDQALRPEVATAPRPEMRLSARNQIRSTVTAVHHGEVMSSVSAVLGDGQPVTAAITKVAAEDLDLAPGDPIVVVVKSTEVMVAKGG